MTLIILDLWFHISKIMEACKEDPSLQGPGQRLREEWNRYHYAEVATILKNKGGVRYFVPSCGLSPDDKRELTEHVETAIEMLQEHGFFGAT